MQFVIAGGNKFRDIRTEIFTWPKIAEVAEEISKTNCTSQSTLGFLFRAGLCSDPPSSGVYCFPFPFSCTPVCMILISIRNMLVFMACLMFCALPLFDWISFTYRPYEVKCGIQIFLQVVFQRYNVSSRIKLLNAAYLTYVPTLHALSRFH